MATVAASTIPDLPVPVLDYPHWRVNFRPDQYQREFIPSLSDCVKLIEQCRVSLRGWDFPHWSRKMDQREFGEHHIATWTSFDEIIEYWRFYQSGQFLHLNVIEEAASPKLHAEWEKITRSHLQHQQVDWSNIRGFLSVLNFYYRIIEIVEFATRLCQKDVYSDYLTIAVELKSIDNFVLTTNWERHWSEVRKCTQANLSNTWRLHSTELIADSGNVTINVAKWFFERFGWLDVPQEFLEREHRNFLDGRL